MKIVIGHKILNLEELYNIAAGAEVVVDAPTYAELNKTAIDKFIVMDVPEEKVQISNLETRAVLTVKLLQILKLKGSAQKATVDLLVSMLNEGKFESGQGFF